MEFHEIEEPDRPGVVIFRLSGQFDFSTAGPARARINQRIQEGARLIVINLDAVDYIDSVGLGALVGALARLSERGGELAVVCCTPRLHRVFNVTKLTQLLTIYASETEAIEGRVPKAL